MFVCRLALFGSPAGLALPERGRWLEFVDHVHSLVGFAPGSARRLAGLPGSARPFPGPVGGRRIVAALAGSGGLAVPDDYPLWPAAVLSVPARYSGPAGGL